MYSQCLDVFVFSRVSGIYFSFSNQQSAYLLRVIFIFSVKLCEVSVHSRDVMEKPEGLLIPDYS